MAKIIKFVVAITLINSFWKQWSHLACKILWENQFWCDYDHFARDCATAKTIPIQLKLFHLVLLTWFHQRLQRGAIITVTNLTTCNICFVLNLPSLSTCRNTDSSWHLCSKLFQIMPNKLVQRQNNANHGSFSLPSLAFLTSGAVPTIWSSKNVFSLASALERWEMLFFTSHSISA